MYRVFSSLAVLSTIYTVSLAQYGDNGNATQKVCRELRDNANATGVQKSMFGLLGLWRVSVQTNFSANSIESAQSNATEDSADAVSNIWLDPFEGIDLNDGYNPYSACAFIIKMIPENTNRRGQDDDTSCSQTLSESCVDAMTLQAAETANWLVKNPTFGPFSNLTPPILGPICQQIGIELIASESMPSQCRPYFYTGDPLDPEDTESESPLLNQFSLTGNLTKPVNCSFYSTTPFTRVSLQEEWNAPAGLNFPYNGTNPAQAYDDLVQAVWPILTVAFQPANVSRQASIGYPDAEMTCLRANNIKAGSRIPPPLPKADAVKFPRSPSWYGVRVGVPVAIVGAALIGLLAWFCWRRKSRRSQMGGIILKSGAADPQIDGVEVYQMTDKSAPAQLAADHKVEMSAGDTPRIPKGSDGKPQEMMASVPPRKQSRQM